MSPVRKVRRGSSLCRSHRPVADDQAVDKAPELVKYPRKWFYISSKGVCRYCAVVLPSGTPLTVDVVGIDLMLEIIHCASGKPHMSGYHRKLILKLLSVGKVNRKAGIATRGCAREILSF